MLNQATNKLVDKTNISKQEWTLAISRSIV